MLQNDGEMTNRAELNSAKWISDFAEELDEDSPQFPELKISLVYCKVSHDKVPAFVSTPLQTF